MAEFAGEHRAEIAARLSRSRHWVLGLDYDGTLTPIVDRAADAHLPPAMRRVLVTLAARPDFTLAFVSGRAAADVERRIGLGDAIYAGNHGLEIRGPTVQFEHRDAAAGRPALDALARTLRHRLAAVTGAWVEHKSLTLSVHDRQVDPGRRDDVRGITQQTLKETPQEFELTSGRCVLEIRPRTDWHKGAAMQWIRSQLQPDAALLFLGDDRTDEDAFRACRDGLTIRVGAGEATAAEFCFASQAEVMPFLHWLAIRTPDERPEPARS